MLDSVSSFIKLGLRRGSPFDRMVTVIASKIFTFVHFQLTNKCENALTQKSSEAGEWSLWAAAGWQSIEFYRPLLFFVLSAAASGSRCTPKLSPFPLWGFSARQWRPGVTRLYPTLPCTCYRVEIYVSGGHWRDTMDTRHAPKPTTALY